MLINKQSFVSNRLKSLLRLIWIAARTTRLFFCKMALRFRNGNEGDHRIFRGNVNGNVACRPLLKPGTPTKCIMNYTCNAQRCKTQMLQTTLTNINLYENMHRQKVVVRLIRSLPFWFNVLFCL